jgi:signal transduction histidine kinase
VRDDGPGIAPENLGRIFDEGFTTRGEGHGLGLTIAKGIVEALGGTLRVESAVGHGATFVVRLRGT